MLPISSSSTIRPCHFALPPLDASLPGSAGEPDLCPPSPAEIAERARGQLLGEAGPEVVAAEWGSARWLPARSITTSYRLLLADGAERLVAFQRWRQGRTAGVPSPRTSADDSRQELIWSFPVDSMLHGLPRLLSPGRTARLLERAGMAPPGAISRRSLKLLPLRYQPERQALVRLELLLDGGAQPPAPWVVAARALPPGEACRVAQAQRALAAGLAPRLLA
nr:hypothetical protein [Thermoanaerobaculia bacterium]